MTFINLRDERYFPRVRKTPHHANTTNDFFVPSPNTVYTSVKYPKAVPEPPTRRLRHWCTIAGLQMGSMLIGVHDMNAGEMDIGLDEGGEGFELIHLRTTGLLNDPRGGKPAVNALRKLLSEGSVAVMYTVDVATQTRIPSTLLHIPDAASIRTFNCGMDRILEINDAFHAKVQAGKLEHCHRCQQLADQRCERCKTSYCGAECQKRDWRKHKDECQVITQIRDWSTFDWDVYEEPYVFKKSLQSPKSSSSS